MFAKHRDAEVAVSKMFQARTVSKHYIALVQGEIQTEGSVDVPLITDWENRPRQMCILNWVKLPKHSINGWNICLSKTYC